MYFGPVVLYVYKHRFPLQFFKKIYVVLCVVCKPSSEFSMHGIGRK